MRHIVYKFLDDYVGGVSVSRSKSSYFSSQAYEVWSDDGVYILSFTIGYGLVKVYNIGGGVFEMIQGYFSTDQKKTFNYIRDWFARKYNTKGYIQHLYNLM